MSKENVELLRRIYDRLAVGDGELFWAHLDPEVDEMSGTHLAHMPSSGWLRSTPGKGAKLTDQDIWKFFSHPQHADPRAVLDWIALSQPDGSTKVVLGPERRRHHQRGINGHGW